MANLTKAVIIATGVQGNGVDTVFTLDLLKDPYNIIAVGNPGGEVFNWFSRDKNVTLPTGVGDASPNSVSLSGTIVTYTFASAPSGETAVEFALFF